MQMSSGALVLGVDSQQGVIKELLDVPGCIDGVGVGRDSRALAVLEWVVASFVNLTRSKMIPTFSKYISFPTACHLC